MTHIELTRPRHAARKPLGTVILGLINLARQRRTLAGLDDAALKDIGLTRAEARAEAARPLWDAPENWYKRL